MTQLCKSIMIVFDLHEYQVNYHSFGGIFIMLKILKIPWLSSAIPTSRLLDKIISIIQLFTLLNYLFYLFNNPVQFEIIF